MKLKDVCERISKYSPYVDVVIAANNGIYEIADIYELNGKIVFDEVEHYVAPIYRCPHCNQTIPNEAQFIHNGECYCVKCKDWNLKEDCLIDKPKIKIKSKDNVIGEDDIVKFIRDNDNEVSLTQLIDHFKLSEKEIKDFIARLLQKVIVFKVTPNRYSTYKDN